MPLHIHLSSFAHNKKQTSYMKTLTLCTIMPSQSLLKDLHVIGNFIYLVKPMMVTHTNNRLPCHRHRLVTCCFIYIN